MVIVDLGQTALGWQAGDHAVFLEQLPDVLAQLWVFPNLGLDDEFGRWVASD